MQYYTTTSATLGTTFAPVNARKLGVVELLINAIAFLYVLSVYLLMAVEYLSRISIILAALLWMAVALNAAITARLSVPKIIVLPWLLCAFNIMSLLWVTDPVPALENNKMVFSSILGATGLMLAFRNGLSWKTFAWAVAIGSVALILSARGEVAASGVEGRAKGLAGNANVLAIYLSYAALIIWCTPVKLPKWLGWLAWAFVAYSVLFTGSRKSLILFGIAILLAAIRNSPKLLRLKGWLAITFVFLLIILVLLTFDFQKINVAEFLNSMQSVSRVQRVFEEKHHSSSELRRNMADDAIGLWRQRPLTGQGAGQFAVLSTYGMYSHNNYTELLADMGAIGLLLYYSLHITIIALAARGIIQGSVEHQHALILVFMLFMLEMAMVTYCAKISWVLLAFIAGLVSMNPRQQFSAQPR